DWVQPVAIRELVHPDNRFKLGFAGWSGPAFDVSGMVLWGFTAGVLDALLRLAGWHEDWDEETQFDLFRTLEQSRNGESRALRAHFAAERKKETGE
ncbi:MAG TPA: CoA pyrophosphatase, partial [Candidatus Corynebacterium intestinavium]|nr:CoA pyrophosphatase [Candidatus Corynebacterium intestinavium]